MTVPGSLQKPTKPTADNGDTSRGYRFKRNVIATAGLLAVLAGWLLLYEATRRASAGADAVAHTAEVVASLRELSHRLFELETRHRDYQVWAGPRELREYRSAAEAARIELARLQRLVASDDQVRVGAVTALVGERIARLDEAVARVQPIGTDRAAAPLQDPGALSSASELATQLDTVEREQRQRLSEQDLAARSLQGTASLALLANGLFTLVVLLAAEMLLNRDAVRQENDEQKLRAALRAADAANEAKAQFLATVSHEIRTPLNAVSGLSELLLETTLDTEQTGFARAVHSNAEALSMLIGDLLDLSRIDAGQVFLDSTPFDLRELVEGVGELLAVRAEVKGIEIIVDVPPQGPRGLIGDRNRLRQVLMNLVGNAVKFTEHGQVVIRGWAEPAANGQTARLRLSVIDSGIGIAPEAQSRIFERFAQAERSTAVRYGGTGLGLNISRSLVELMGGTITLRSEVAHGSEFDVDIELALASEQPPQLFGSTSLAGVTVLLVKPNTVLRDTAARLLEFAGASVRGVSTAEEGVAEIAKGGVRVAMVGDSLPDSSGLEFARSLWHRQDGTPAPGISVVLMCSLRAMAAGYVGSYGISGCVYKPVKQARLIEAVRLAAGLDTGEIVRPAAAPQPEVTGRWVPLRVLLVEDHRDNWNLATQILTSVGYDVDRAEDGVRAMEADAAFAYDLILMDIELPFVDGIEATQLIRARERETERARVPVVALTAHGVDSVRQQALAAGMDDYATKPFQKQQLLDICRKWMDARPSILIVDDAPEIHVLLANYFRGSNYRLVFAFNGRDAVDAFVRQRISLVLLDMHMPIMDGFEAAREIRQARAGDVVPIVGLTGDDRSEGRPGSWADSCDGHLSKPVRRDELLATVANLLGVPASRRRRLPGSPAPERPPGQEERRAAGGTSLPSGRDTLTQARRLLALRDFDGLAGLGGRIGTTAKALRLNKLVTVSQELVDAARSTDVARAELWGEGLAPAVTEAHRLLARRLAAGSSAHRGGYCDTLAHVATLLLDVPTAVVTLVAGDLIQIRGGVGLPASLEDQRDTPLHRSFTWFVMDQGQPLILEDVRADARLQDAMPVVAHGVVALAAVPLADADGNILGAFCAMDRRPHRWPAQEIAILEELAGIAMRMLEMERLLERQDPDPRTAAAAPGASPSSLDAAPSSPGAAAEDEVNITVDDDIVDLVPGYVGAQRQAVATLLNLLEGGDFMSIRRQGHRMKGSGAGYGLPGVSRIGKELEAAAESGDAESVKQLITDLQRYLSRLSIRSADGRVVMTR
jgi:signal transduction histidine kinase/CheY-like chemotaxis protein/HPt (histidine-containing phosphotransfer) domain-containing protein